jgi:3-hydroxyacyl-CoA dehydrogenase/enoyl-CoA hydratase/3-hydroxybutyryl-CoA epimerase
MDAAGLETIAYVHDCLRPFLGERIAGLACLWPMVRAGYLGRRVGLGFYEYGPACRRPNPAVAEILGAGHRPAGVDPDELFERPVWMMLAEAARCVGEGVVADWEHADLGANLGLVFPQSQGGLLAYHRRVGEAAIRRQFEIWERRYGPRFQFEGTGRSSEVPTLPSPRRRRTNCERAELYPGSTSMAQP